MRIVTKNLSYYYSAKTKFSVHALDGVSLTIEEGEFFGIIGHTGSGKSTFIQHLNGLIRPEKNCGSVVVGEFDLTDSKCDVKKLRSKVGMVFQYPEYQLFAETVFEDVAFGLKNFENLTAEETEKRVKDALTTVGLNYEEVKDKSPFELSGGQKRRVAIAGVIVTRPEVLVLDEPVAGLDPKGKREFFALLHDLHASFVKTIIIVSHDMDNVAENCTRVAIFDHGKIYKEGTVEDIFSCPDELVSLGLDVPVTGYVSGLMAKKGARIRTNFSIDDFTDKVIQKIKGGVR